MLSKYMGIFSKSPESWPRIGKINQKSGTKTNQKSKKTKKNKNPQKTKKNQKNQKNPPI
jgi:hypothetical protein